MTYNEFWYGDARLLTVAQKAYYRDKTYVAWLQGQYNAVAFNIVLHNAFAKKGTKAISYPEYKDPLPTQKAETITKDNLEMEFRKSQKNQNAWLHNILHKK